MIDWNKPIQTKDGRKAEFVRKLKGPESHPYIVVLTNNEYIESLARFNESGCTGPFQACIQLENVPERFEHAWYVNVFRDGPFGAFTTRAIADSCTKSGRIACIRVPIAGAVGQFDE